MPKYSNLTQNYLKIRIFEKFSLSWEAPNKYASNEPPTYYPNTIISQAMARLEPEYHAWYPRDLGHKWLRKVG